MYVCICKGITEKQIQEVLTSRNSLTPKEVLKVLGVGSDCGTCVEETINKLIETNSRVPREMKDSSNNS